MVLRGVDPGTGLIAGPILAVDLDHAGCGAYWRAEIFEESVNRFVDLARRRRGVASLRQANGGLRRRSAVFRDYMRPRGLGDELRGVLRVDGRVYGHVSLFRTEHATPFSERDLDTVDAWAQPLARQLRAHLLGQLGPDATSSAPGVTILDASNRLISASKRARDHLAAVGAMRDDEVMAGSSQWLETLALQARATAHELAGEPATVRIPAGPAAWLVFHAEPVDASDPDGEVAVISQGARPSELQSLIIDAYHLTARELQVAELVAQGLVTNEIATRLSVSPHTVRDHLKAVFEKMSVSTRGALVAKLFLVHFEPSAVTGMTHTGSETLPTRAITP
jgi:DNA-binding CsgD family transcriptional regulator